jgi:hypothetical protein
LAQLAVRLRAAGNTIHIGKDELNKKADPVGQQGTRNYTLGQVDGSIMRVALPVDAAALRAFTARVAAANRWGTRETRTLSGKFNHVIYIIKENRTFDQVLGDLSNADGDPSLCYFPRKVSPNHHALAERFGIFDRFFVNAEVSAEGHNWSTAAYTTDYTEKTTPAGYSDRSTRPYDYQGTNRDVIVDEDDFPIDALERIGQLIDDRADIRAFIEDGDDDREFRPRDGLRGRQRVVRGRNSRFIAAL